MNALFAGFKCRFVSSAVFAANGASLRAALIRRSFAAHASVGRRMLVACLMLSAGLSVTARRIETQCIENPQVKAFYDQVTYPDNDYSFSLIGKYLIPQPYRLDQPFPVVLRWTTRQVSPTLEVTVSEQRDLSRPLVRTTINGHTSEYRVWNLTPGHTYYYKVTAAGGRVLTSGAVKAEGHRRMIHLESVHNMRDIGGLPALDGRHLRYGRIYRGGELSKPGRDKHKNEVDTLLSRDDARAMRYALNIRAEIDFRNDRELGYNDGIEGNDVNYSVISSDVTYYNIRLPQPYRIDEDANFGKVLKVILSYLRRGEAVYVHCVAGADRTGALNFMIEGLLGVGEDQLMKDYELTTFSKYGLRHRDSNDWKQGLAKLRALPGNTLQSKIRYMFKQQGATDAELDEFADLMLEK